MKIAIIGVGNVGSALAKKFSEVGHQIYLGLRKAPEDKIIQLQKNSSNIFILNIEEAINKSDAVLFATPPAATVEIAKKNFNKLKDKIIIDATNSVFVKPEPYKTAFEGIKKETSNDKVVKCFNSTGFENMIEPKYGKYIADMFAAGSNSEAKNKVIQLAEEIGFEKCYDFGGDDKVELLEQFAMSWINLAIMQKYGREIAFKIISR